MNLLADLPGVVYLVPVTGLLQGVHVNASPERAGSPATNAQMAIGERNVKVRHPVSVDRGADISLHWRLYAVR